jgi:hypothetical protein
MGHTAGPEGRGAMLSREDKISSIGINKLRFAESGFDRENFIRKLVRGIPVKRNSYNEFVRRLTSVV